MNEEDQITALFRRVKPGEPPDGYVDRFLEDFHRRQQSEIIRTPAWKLAWERVVAGVVEFQVPRYAYGAAFAAFVAAAFFVVNSPRGGVREPATASNAVPLRLEPQETALTLADPEVPMRSVHPVYDAPPHYVLDARPVSYEPPFSF